MRIPYIIDNIAIRLADVLNDLLQREQGQQVHIATAYFSIRGFELLRNALPGVRHCRLLLGRKSLEGGDIGLRPHLAAYLLQELDAEPFTEGTLGQSRSWSDLSVAMMCLFGSTWAVMHMRAGGATSYTPNVTSSTVEVMATRSCSIICIHSSASLADDRLQS